MGSSKLTDEELCEIAKLGMDSLEDDTTLDVGYYQQYHLIKDGNHSVLTKHLYRHYSDWSSDPVSLNVFLDMIQLNYKNENFLNIDNEICNIDLNKLLGEYVKKERRKEKEKRLRKVPSFKPEI